MSLVRPIRKSSRGLVSYRVLIVCVASLSLLSVRIAPPSLPHVSTGLAVNSQADHDHRLCFDHEDSPWATAPGTAPNTPPPVVSLHLTLTAEAFVDNVTDGLHYNRPPPIS
jgi:hypothetical protein